MKKLDPKVIAFGIIGIVVLIFVLMIFGIIPGIKKTKTGPTLSGSITVWTIGKDQKQSETNFRTLVDIFNSSYPSVQVTQKNFSSLEDYENALLDALSSGEGPDVFMVLNSAVPRYANKITPIPETAFSLEDLRSKFPQVVEQNFAPQGKIYGLPLSIDTLALVYNRDLIDQAAVSLPTTWEEFQDLVPKITSIENGNLVTPGAAIGTSDTNIWNAADMMSLLMLQTGTKMIDASFTKATFNSDEGKQAVQFYTQFSNPLSLAYTWNSSLPDSRDMFAQEKTAIIFDYAETVKVLKDKNKFLNIGIAEMPSPQTQKEKQKRMSYPRYFGYAVSKQSKNQDIGSAFIVFLTTNENSAKKNFELTKMPPALRTLLVSLKNDSEIGVFARQALIANSWAQIDNRLVSRTFSDMIEKVEQNGFQISSFLEEANDTISRAMSKNKN